MMQKHSWIGLTFALLLVGNSICSAKWSFSNSWSVSHSEKETTPTSKTTTTTTTRQFKFSEFETTNPTLLELFQKIAPDINRSTNSKIPISFRTIHGNRNNDCIWCQEPKLSLGKQNYEFLSLLNLESQEIELIIQDQTNHRLIHHALCRLNTAKLQKRVDLNPRESALPQYITAGENFNTNFKTPQSIFFHRIDVEYRLEVEVLSDSQLINVGLTTVLKYSPN